MILKKCSIAYRFIYITNYKNMNKAYLLVICLLLTSFVGCLEESEEIEEKQSDEAKCPIISGEYEMVQLLEWRDDHSQGYWKFSDSKYDVDTGKCNVNYNLVNLNGDLHVNSDGTVYDYSAEISGNASNMIIIMSDQSYNATLEDSGNITIVNINDPGYIFMYIPCTGCFDAAKTGEFIDESVKEPDEGSEKPEDTYSCEINSEGYCIFTGTPHQEGLEPGTDNIVDREGNYLFGVDEALSVNSEGTTLQARGTPAFDGDQLIQSSQEDLSEDEKAFHKVMAIMFPIRNALMYDIASVNQDEWNALVNELEIREIKETTFTDGATPKDNYYGRQGIFDLAKDPNGKDIHHDVMKFLEESGLYLLCHVTSDEFAEMLAETHPENHNPCEDAEITTKIPFAEDIENNTIQVTEVVDGDTFYLENGDKVRMLGINTPESGRPYSEEATEFLTNMILGKEVNLVNDSKNGDSDSYGRLLAHVYVDDTFVNYEIIKAGFAFWYPYTSGTDFDSEYEEAQNYASNNMVGLWTESSYNLTIDYIEYDPEGDEAEGEYVVLTNHENYNVSMVGWFLQDEAAQTAYEFDFIITNNTSIRIYTGDGTDNATTLFWGWYQGIWNNSGDFAIIQDENGYLVDSYRYD